MDKPSSKFAVTEKQKTKTLVVTPKFKHVAAPHLKTRFNQNGHIDRSAEKQLEEAIGLAQAIELDVTVSMVASLQSINSSTFLGPGKVSEIADICKEQKIELAIVDHALSPVQQRNLERAISAKVLDRTALILEIFGKRAKTREGRLQVELAHLEYQKSRLVRSWTHLERQRGGVGFLGGPGETQIEADRRMLQKRIGNLRRELEDVKRTRELHRKGRERVPYPVVALVGYTNAGKSTLFNYLTGERVFAKDLLFATLDPTMRELVLPSRAKIIISDTVGFISDLPTHLVAAFRATLEEVSRADLILHVRDISHEETDVQMHDVNNVLNELGIEHDTAGSNVIYVWNKVDLLDQEQLESLEHQANMQDENIVMVSASTGRGTDNLLETIDQMLREQHHTLHVKLESHEGAMVNWLYENTEVLEQGNNENGDLLFHVRAAPEVAKKLGKMTGK